MTTEAAEAKKELERAASWLEEARAAETLAERALLAAREHRETLSDRFNDARDGYFSLLIGRAS